MRMCVLFTSNMTLMKCVWSNCSLSEKSSRELKEFPLRFPLHIHRVRGQLTTTASEVCRGHLCCHIYKHSVF